MALQNFIARGLPTISAVWLNQVDTLKYTIFGDATSKMTARANLTSDNPLEVANGGTGTRLADGSGIVNLGGTSLYLGAILYPQTPAEVAASVTPVNMAYRQGEPQRYGVVGDGLVDDTTALINWAKVGGRLTFPAITCLITGTITLYAGTTINGCAGGTIKTNTANISIFTAANQTGIEVIGMNFLQTTGGANAYVGHCVFDTCVDVTVRDCTFDGIQWAGIYFTNCLRAHFDNNYFQNLVGTSNETADILGWNNNNYCTITNNKCFAPTNVGIMLQDPYNVPAKAPFKCIVEGNRVGAHTAYGILVYCPGAQTAGGINLAGGGTIVGGSGYSSTTYIGVSLTGGSGTGATANIVVSGGVVTVVSIVNTGSNYVAGDVLSAAGIGAGSGFTYTLGIVGQPQNTYNEIRNNHVQDITGSQASNTFSGAGIYVVGFGCGGTSVEGNSVKNCNINTVAGRTLAPGAIVIAGVIGSTNLPIIVSGNTIGEQTQYEGINIESCKCGVNVEGNVIQLPSTNTTGAGIRVSNSDSVTVDDNIIFQLGSQDGLLCYSNTVACNDITFSNNRVVSQAGSTLRFTFQAVGLRTSGAIINSNTLSTTSNTPSAMRLENIDDVVVNGNRISNGSASTVLISNCTNCRGEMNIITGTGTIKFTTASTCTGGYWGESNRGVSGNADLSNAGTGLIFNTFGTAAPTAGTWALGDSVRNSLLSSAGTWKWICTNAGTGGGTAVFKAVAAA